MVHWRGGRYGFEFTSGDAPSLTKSMHVPSSDLKLDRVFVIRPGEDSYVMNDQTEAVSIKQPASAVGAIRLWKQALTVRGARSDGVGDRGCRRRDIHKRHAVGFAGTTPATAARWNVGCHRGAFPNSVAKPTLPPWFTRWRRGSPPGLRLRGAACRSPPVRTLRRVGDVWKFVATSLQSYISETDCQRNHS